MEKVLNHGSHLRDVHLLMSPEAEKISDRRLLATKLAIKRSVCMNAKSSTAKPVLCCDAQNYFTSMQIFI